MEQLLWFEVFTKAVAGLTMLVAPVTAIRILGLQRPATAFWPRLGGGLLVGIAAAVFVTLYFPNAKGGLGSAGLVAINLGGAAALLVPLIMGNAAPTRRGWLFILVCLALLLTLSFLEIAHI